MTKAIAPFAALATGTARAGSDQYWKTAADDAAVSSVSLGSLAVGSCALFVLLYGLLAAIEFWRARDSKYGWQAAGCAIALIALFDLMKFAG